MDVSPIVFSFIKKNSEKSAHKNPHRELNAEDIQDDVPQSPTSCYNDSYEGHLMFFLLTFFTATHRTIDKNHLLIL